MTEATHQMTSNPLPPAIQKPGLVGMPAGPEICIMNDKNEKLAQGEIGEYVLKGIMLLMDMKIILKLIKVVL